MKFTLAIVVTEAWPFVSARFSYGKLECSLRDATRLTKEYAAQNGGQALFDAALKRAVAEARARWAIAK